MELTIHWICFVSSRLQYVAQRISQNVREARECICILFGITVNSVHSDDASSSTVVIIIILPYLTWQQCHLKTRWYVSWKFTQKKERISIHVDVVNRHEPHNLWDAFCCASSTKNFGAARILFLVYDYRMCQKMFSDAYVMRLLTNIIIGQKR